jgi:hypothetical protein
MSTEKPEQQFAVVEMMGHRKVAGAIKQSELAPGALIRVDVFGSDGHIDRTEHIGTSAIYDITIVTEQVAKATAIAHAPEPSFAFDILKPRPDRSLPGMRNFDPDEDDEPDYEDRF